MQTFLTKFILFAISVFFLMMCLVSFRPYDNETCSEKEYSFNRIVNLATLAKKKKKRKKIKTKLWPYTVKQCQKKSPIQGKFYTWCLSHGAEVRVYFAVCLIYQNLNFTIIFFFKSFLLTYHGNFLQNFVLLQANYRSFVIEYFFFFLIWLQYFFIICL